MAMAHVRFEMKYSLILLWETQSTKHFLFRLNCVLDQWMIPSTKPNIRSTLFFVSQGDDVNLHLVKNSFLLERFILQCLEK